jgi:hypothetical protein
LIFLTFELGQTNILGRESPVQAREGSGRGEGYVLIGCKNDAEISGNWVCISQAVQELRVMRWALRVQAEVLDVEAKVLCPLFNPIVCKHAAIIPDRHTLGAEAADLLNALLNLAVLIVVLLQILEPDANEQVVVHPCNAGSNANGLPDVEETVVLLAVHARASTATKASASVDIEEVVALGVRMS